MISNNKLDIFKRSISIVTKTIGKKKETEINFVTEESNIEGNYVNLKNHKKIFQKKIFLKQEVKRTQLEVRFVTTMNQFIKNILETTMSFQNCLMP